MAKANSAPITVPCPIFYETLAASAHCTTEDAYAVYHTMNPTRQQHHVEGFLEDYAVTEQG